MNCCWSSQGWIVVAYPEWGSGAGIELKVTGVDSVDHKYWEQRNEYTLIPENSIQTNNNLMGKKSLRIYPFPRDWCRKDIYCSSSNPMAIGSQKSPSFEGIERSRN
jgi:hypothetical protein